VHSLDIVHPLTVVLELAESVSVSPSLSLADIEPVPIVIVDSVGSPVGSVALCVTDELDPSATGSHDGSSGSDLPPPHGE